MSGLTSRIHAPHIGRQTLSLLMSFLAAAVAAAALAVAIADSDDSSAPGAAVPVQVGPGGDGIRYDGGPEEGTRGAVGSDVLGNKLGARP